ncbi:MAG: hypothetical protein ACMG6S_09625, partial [Byssovorax sp.]
AVEHVVRFSRGTPVKVRPGDGFSRLGEMLIERGALKQETLTEALATNGLLGDVLLLAGCVDRDRLEETCVTQFQRRMTRLFTLPPETTFRYCDGHTELLDYGSELARADALAILWTGVKAHGGRRSVINAALARLGDLPLRLHPQATVARLGLDPDEARVIGHLQTQPEALRALAARSFLTTEMLRRLLYALVITRQLDLGASTPPVGATDPVSRSRSTTANVARVQLKPTPHRQGAAAPDAPGDGERAPMSSKSTIAPRRTITTPLATARLQDEPTVTAMPQKATAAVRETLKSFGADRTSENPRRISVEVVALDAPSRAPQSEPVPASRPPGPVPASRPPGPVPPSKPPEPVPASRPPEPVDAPKSTAPPALQGLSASELFDLAGARLAERNLDSAEEACVWACRAAPENQDFAVLATWIRAQRAGADLKLLTIELDELLSASPDHRNARYYRALLRKRLGDNAGAIRDLQRLRDRTPPDAEAMKALEALVAPAEKPKSGLLGWLFKR